MFFRGQKGSPVKLEFNIFIENIEPWTSAQAQSDGAAIPVFLAWRRGSKRSGSTKSVIPSVGGSDGGKVVFNESFKLPATLFVRKSGGFQKKSVTFALLEDESAKTVKISRQLGTGELDLSQFGNSTEPCSTRIPLSIGLGGTQAEGDPTLSLRVSSTGRFASSPSTSSGRLSSGGRSEAPQRTSYFLPESDDSDNEQEIDPFTDDEESPGSPDGGLAMSAQAIEAMKREILFSPYAILPSKLLYPNPVIARERPSSTPARLSDGQSSGRSFSAAKVAEASGKEVRESLKWTEEEKRQVLLGLSQPRRSLAAAAKTLETAAASAARSVEAARRSMRNSGAEKNLEAVAALAENYKAAEIEAAAAIKAVEAAAASLGSTVVAATAIYAKRKASLSMNNRPSECSTSESPPSPSSVSPPSPSSISPPDSGAKLELSQSPQVISDVPAPSCESSGQPAEVACAEKANSEKKAPDPTDDQTDYKSLLKEAKTKFAMIERRTLEELRSKVASAVANEENGKQMTRSLEEKLTKREDELRDTAAIEVALYSAAAEHTSSSHKLHTPARRLARLYVYAFKSRSSERRASAARNSVLGLVVAVRACGNDIPRLTFWWSNIVVLRETIMQACNVEPAAEYSGGASTSGGDDSFADRARRSQQLRQRSYWQGSIGQILGLKNFSNDWQDCNTYVVALLRVETWIHGRILECVWWQVMSPPMQVNGGDATPRRGALGARFLNVRDELNRFAVKVKDGLGELNKFAEDVKEFFSRQSSEGNLSQLGDPRHGTNSIEVWKNAFTDALKRLCPLQGHDAECGCLPVLSRQVIAECVDRLDVAMFNGILRNPEHKSPTDPIADPIQDLSVLPIPAGDLTFGAGSQLKNAVVTWSTWLSGLLTMREPNPAESISKGPSVEHSEQPVEEVQRQQRFSYLKATGELLMQLPKDMIDMAMRRESSRRPLDAAKRHAHGQNCEERGLPTIEAAIDPPHIV
ncbi:hypothetical protein M758_10G140300 [Ceratodon purpureus]|nr:hypothetical protein M758_10G140300 [Ceratodon purpureus]